MNNPELGGVEFGGVEGVKSDGIYDFAGLGINGYKVDPSLI